MIISRFLKPKWQRNDPATRINALQTLDSAAPTLLEMARQDPDAGVRQAALERLTDLHVLHAIADSDADAGVRTAAQERYRSLLAGKTADSPPLADRLVLLRAGLEHELIDYLLQQAAEPELRLAALERIDPETTLAEIAAHNLHQDVRLAASERVNDPTLLEQIARQARNRDKRLYRRTRERLDALAITQASTAQLERLCAEMEQLPWDGESGPHAGRFPKLEHEWREREAAAQPELRERYAQARARFLAERQASANRRAQRLELIASLERLLERLQQESQPNEELTAALHQAAQDTPLAWSRLGPAHDAESRRLDARFQQLGHEIGERERTLQRDQSRADRLQAALREAEALLEQPSEVRDIDLKQLRQRWEALERPESRPLASELQSRFDGLLDKLRARLQRQIQQRDQEWQALQDSVQALEAALEAGELQQATELNDQAREQIKRNIGLTRAQLTAIEERLQHCASRIGELRGWRRWGAHQAREQLCVTTESLIGLEIDPPDLAKRIQKVREAWKDLDHHEGAAPKALWKRFNEACERAYAPCQAYFEAQNRERLQNFEKKQALCAQLEEFVAATNWEQPDWREADRLHRRSREQWYKLGPVNRSERKALDQRFQLILQQLEAHLSVERAHELQRRQQLVQQVQALSESPELRHAIDTAKRAQAEWHPTVQASPRQEQALWKEFRAVCDAVFARRELEQQAAATERQSNLAHRLALCAEVEALVGVDAAQLSEARARLETIQQAWHSAGLAPKADQRSLEQRFDAALEQFAQHERFLKRVSKREIFQQLHARSRLCARLERLLALAPVDTGLLAQDRQTWETLPPLPTTLSTAMQGRFNAALAALTEAPEQAPALIAQLEQNLERKQIGCIQMEIVAGIESPPEFAQQRMEYQVARLSASLAGSASKADHLHDPRLLQEEWCLIGALPADVEAELDTRFLRALDAWRQQEDT